MYGGNRISYPIYNACRYLSTCETQGGASQILGGFAPVGHLHRTQVQVSTDPTVHGRDLSIPAERFPRIWDTPFQDVGTSYLPQ
jgi:hypothetical protein